MSAALDVVSTVKLLAAPSAEIALAAVVLTGFAVPAVPVNTSTFGLSAAAAGATPMAALASSAPANASGLRSRGVAGGMALLQVPILLPPPTLSNRRAGV